MKLLSVIIMKWKVNFQFEVSEHKVAIFLFVSFKYMDALKFIHEPPPVDPQLRTAGLKQGSSHPSKYFKVRSGSEYQKWFWCDKWPFDFTVQGSPASLKQT